ncbi:membrane protein [Shinella zoogloeoides]
MRSFLYAIVIGLIGAALLHIVIILSLPSFTGRDAYTRVQSLGEANRFYKLAEKPGDTLAPINDDPAMETSVCTFSVENGPIRLYAEGDVPFWSLAIYDEASNEVFSMNDRTSVSGALDTLIATPIQLIGIRKAVPPELEQSILVEMRGEEGYAVLRTFVPTESRRKAADGFLADASCEPFTPDQ